MRVIKITVIFSAVLLLISAGIAQELPKPTFDNSMIISIEHYINDTPEIDYIKNNLTFGLYAWLSISHTHKDPVLDWHHDWNDAGNGIQSFKDYVNGYIQSAKDQSVKFHLVVCSGLARGLYIYKEAKEEDIRNCQWYNDNKLASDSQITDPDAMDNYIFGTFSRYARKMRRNLKAKAQAAAEYLKQKLDAEPDTLIALSGWGEAEMNFNRLSGGGPQEYFCDFSPFAVLEFRDWIRHTGMYEAGSGEYAGEGYSAGGSRYRDANGLSNFNTDFATNFTSWHLKYYNWYLVDDYDTNPVDYVNNDPRRIPIGSYSHGDMMPTSGTNYLAGGFDPPRTMNPGDDFWDLWNLFRETMVHHLILDMAKWVDDANIPAEKWYSHQIPADYLFGTHPGSTTNNARYYSSASPMWSADIRPYGSVGTTMYDIKFPGFFARTSLYGIPALADMGSNTAALEYDAEVYPTGYSVSESTPAYIRDQYMNVYNHGIHLINFWRWWDDSGEHRIKGKNKEEALRQFVDNVRDKARSTNMSLVYDPPRISVVIGHYDPLEDAIVIELSKIWSDEDWMWKQWGDFDHFRIYRSTDPDFTTSPSNYIGSTEEYTYEDKNYIPGVSNYYRVRAVNSADVKGDSSDVIELLPAVSVPILSVSKSSLKFGAEQGNCVTSPEEVLIINTGAEGTVINWKRVRSHGWITADPANGVGDSVINIGADISGLSAGTYNGTVTISDSMALNSPQVIQICLTVYSPGGDEAPFGNFETPVNNSTVSGSIAVTGWALDDVEVTRVQIKRSSHATDPPAAIGPDGLVFITDSVFIKGARPDVEAAYPNYPRNDQAGWGSMVLTNFLPNSGNCTVMLYVFAYDDSGHKVELGQKTITADNANRVKPFGTIDTPAQAEIIFGTAYVNFGWALTPQPKKIPEDGSTIWVWIDGQPLGHPSYGHYRVDIATLFPGYQNSDGAIGYFYVDTTQFTNGIHNISWSVADDNGDSDGIGLRRYTIQNLGGSGAVLEAFKYVEDSIGRLQIDVFGYERGMKLRTGRAARKEGQGKALLKPDSDKNGAVVFNIEEIERLEIHLKGSKGHSFLGWGRDTTHGLPEGSILDRKNGIFYWQPSPGFLGRFEIHFAVTDGIFYSQPLKIVVNIVPKKYQH